MTDPRTIAPPFAVVALALGAAFAGACAPRVAGPERPGHALIVLLPDEDGTTGRAVVTNPSGSADLNQPRNATDVASNQAPGTVSTMSEADVRRLFGDALDALPPAPRSFTLYFRFESDELTDESKALVPRNVPRRKSSSSDTRTRWAPRRQTSRSA
jgi:hypothetical protein